MYIIVLERTLSVISQMVLLLRCTTHFWCSLLPLNIQAYEAVLRPPNAVMKWRLRQLLLWLQGKAYNNLHVCRVVCCLYIFLIVNFSRWEEVRRGWQFSWHPVVFIVASKSGTLVLSSCLSPVVRIVCRLFCANLSGPACFPIFSRNVSFRGLFAHSKLDSGLWTSFLGNRIEKFSATKITKAKLNI